MDLFTFIQWCFRDEDSTVGVLVVGVLVAIGLRYVAEGFRK